MHNLVKIAAMGLLLGATGTTAADCTAPDVPTMPSGSTASMEEMLSGQQAVKAFQAANLEYMGCLDPMIAAAKAKADSEEATKDDLKTLKSLEEQYNAAVSEEEDLAGKFNAQIRAYKEANPG
ncbi:MAG: hypothetical protein NXI15_08620 [Gammaproteobacteria bacterium]|nr:hypothetical protein [Gammaproteobacteria bacterium]